MKSKIAIPNNPSSWLFNQKAERIQLNNHRLKTEGLNSSTKSTDTGHFRPV